MANKESCGDNASLTILVVDDQLIVRECVATVLEGEGYHVLTAENGHAAVAVSRRAGRIDVLLTDIQMPGMNGIELSRIITRDRPLIRVLMMSAGDPDELDIGPSRIFLQKPFHMSLLREMVAAI